MLKLNLGSGKKISKGMVNIDIQNYQGLDYVCDVTKDLPFEKNTVDLIYNCGILEHFSRKDWRNVLVYWFSLLKEGGKLQISTVDFDAICERYLEKKNIDELVGLLLGGSKDWTDRHAIIFNFNYLRNALEQIGFKNVQRCDWKNFEPYKLDENFDDFSRAYLPHMDFENGKCMVLNIEATK